MTKHPDSYYQRFTKPYCECPEIRHKHENPCKSRRYLIVHHKDHKRQDQGKDNLITLCSSRHRKEHRKQSWYYGREDQKSWAEQAREEMQVKQLEASL